ncbi:DUF4157 domain-containing protein [Streptomyces albulus]|nr:DUF4157 domain-containing protein [Streptomyces noursei]
MEEQLGHDFSQVRLHTDRDSGRLADLMGADAFAVGRDVFFREGAYRPGTADGRRLLAHELLHTVQDPHGPGALRAGRDLGAVSLPRRPSNARRRTRPRSPSAPPCSAPPARTTRPRPSSRDNTHPAGSATPRWTPTATAAN